MNRVAFLLLASLAPLPLLASEAQHVLGGLVVPLFSAAVAIALVINLMVILLHHKTKNKFTVVLNYLTGGITAYSGFSLFFEKDDTIYLFGLGLIFVGLITIALQLVDLFSKKPGKRTW